jgi:hypothetical protein
MVVEGEKKTWPIKEHFWQSDAYIGTYSE